MYAHVCLQIDGMQIENAHECVGRTNVSFKKRKKKLKRYQHGICAIVPSVGPMLNER